MLLKSKYRVWISSPKLHSAPVALLIRWKLSVYASNGFIYILKPNTYLSFACLTGPFGAIRWDNCALPLPARGRVLGLCDPGAHWLHPGYHQGSTVALPCPQDCQCHHRRKDSGMKGYLRAKRVIGCFYMLSECIGGLLQFLLWRTFQGRT